MSVFSRIKARPGGRSLSDIDISESSWKPDFDIADRYQGFGNEILRLALLGIAVYGFLIKEVFLKEPKPSVPAATIYFLSWGSISLGLSLCLVLIHRFFTTSCLFYQIIILRSLKRLANDHWTEEEKEIEKAFLLNVKTVQRNKSRLSHYILVFGVIFFAIGSLCVIAVFIRFFHSL